MVCPFNIFRFLYNAVRPAESGNNLNGEAVICPFPRKSNSFCTGSVSGIRQRIVTGIRMMCWRYNNHFRRDCLLHLSHETHKLQEMRQGRRTIGWSSFMFLSGGDMAIACFVFLSQFLGKTWFFAERD